MLFFAQLLPYTTLMKKPLLPFVATPDEEVERMIELSDVQTGMRTMDLGAGDGKVVIAMAKAGATAYVVEIQEKYVRRAKANIAQANVQGKAFVSAGDFWELDLKEYDIITIYCMAMLMERLSEKLTRELRPGTIVISNGFPIPNWKLKRKEEFLYVYEKE
jgi:ribosomal protein L11 methylase PrmA